MAELYQQCMRQTSVNEQAKSKHWNAICYIGVALSNLGMLSTFEESMVSSSTKKDSNSLNYSLLYLSLASDISLALFYYWPFETCKHFLFAMIDPLTCEVGSTYLLLIFF